MKQLVLGIFFLVGFLSAHGASADERYAVSGRIEAETLYCLLLDPPCERILSGPIPVDRARVVIRKLNGSLVTTTRSRPDGTFRVKVRSGIYQLSLPGFDEARRFRVGGKAKDLGTISVIPRAHN